MRLAASCYKCQTVWHFESPMPRGEECPKCHWDAHVCLNCKHYDPNFHHECRETQAEYVKNKDRSNFCDYFDCKPNADGGGSAADAHRQRLEQLFSGSPKDDASSPPQASNLADELAAFLKNKK